jgi:hypothetical protein
MNPRVTVLSELYADFDKQAMRVVARYDMHRYTRLPPHCSRTSMHN